MKPALHLCLALAAALLVTVPAVAAGAKASSSDIAPPEKRRTVVEAAQRLAQVPVVPPAATDLPQPFAPPGFGKADASEAHDATAARPDAKAAVAAAPQTDRDVLEAVASKIPTTGTIILGGTPLLISGTNRLQVGSRFTVVYNGQEYELELVAIDRTTFTLRYKGEEFTRPIKLGKTP